MEQIGEAEELSLSEVADRFLTEAINEWSELHEGEGDEDEDEESCDYHRCPACGEPVSDSADECPSCEEEVDEDE